MKIKKINRLRRWFYNNTYKLIGLKCGPVMISIRGEYLYLDPHGQLFRIVPTYQSDIPLMIELFRK